MIHRIFSDLATFKHLEFHPGFNVLMARRHEKSTDLQTRNRAGKSSFVQIVHFLLGGSAGTDSIFRKPELASHSFGMDFDLGSSRVIAERRGASQGRTAIVQGASSDWPVQPSNARGVRSSLSTADWRCVLGNIWFGLGNVDDSVLYQPSFRALFSYFARREADEGMRRPEMQSRMQQPWDQQTAVSYLLGLDWAVASDWQIVRDRERTLTELRRAAKEGAFGEMISTSAQLRTQLVVAEQSARRVREALEEFEILPEYRELEQEASRLTRELGMLADENTIDEEVVSTIRAAMRNEATPEPKDVERMYREAGIHLPEGVRRRFSDVERFHASVISNRRSYLDAELSASEVRLTRRREKMAVADNRRAEIMRLLQSRGALDQFQQLQHEVGRLDAATEALRQRFQAAQQLEGVKSELELERGRLLQRLRRDLTEQSQRVEEAIATFEEISKALYEDAGSLTLAPTDNGLKVDIEIQGDRSRGIRNMQVFCFDMMILRLNAGRGNGPGFLIHDSHLFADVDERQVAKALQIGAQTAESSGWQYIVTMNDDTIPVSLPHGFKLEDFILDVRLTDEREDGGLFGIRF